MANLPTFGKGSERFKRNMKKVTDLGDDHEARISKLEKGGGGGVLFDMNRNGTFAIYRMKAELVSGEVEEE